jgi:hypothetical protein
LTDDKTEITNPIDVLEYANVEVKAAHIRHIGSLLFPGSHLGGGLGPAQHMRRSDCRFVDSGINIVIDELVLRDSSVREAQWLEEMVRKDG